MSGDPATHSVVLVSADGRERRIQVPEDRSILDAAEDAGAALPFGCRTGACATCAAQLVEGAVEHRRPPRALKPRHLEEGYVLACVAEPRADCRLRVGSDVAGELVSNPWR